MRMRTWRRGAAGVAVMFVTFGSISRTAAEPAEAELAAEILKAAGRTKGLCLDLGCGSGRLASELVKQSQFFVQALETDEERVAAARRTLEATGLYAERTAVEKGSLARLPYPDYCANLIVRGDSFADGPQGMSWKELLRVLQPGGLAYVGQGKTTATDNRLTADSLRRSLRDAGITDFEIVERNGVWAKIRRSRPEGMGEWTHGPDGTPGNNPCADDDLAKAPFHTLWINRPQSFTKFGLIVASSGRLILRHGGMTHTGRWKPPKQPDLVQAFDGYNGIKLWQRRLPQLHGEGLVAVGDGVYAEAGNTLYALAAADGAIRWSLAPPDPFQQMYWSRFASADGTLVAGLRSGPKQKNNTPPTTVLLGLNPDGGKVVWTFRHDSRIAGIALGQGLVFYRSLAGHVGALAIATGQPHWQTPYKARGGMRHHRGRLYFDNAVFDASDGTLLSRSGVRGILVGDRAIDGGIGGIWATNLASGKKTRIVEAPWDPYSPKTGIPRGGIYGRCVARRASTHCFFFTYSGTAIADLARGTLFPTEAFRANCRTGTIVGNGLVYNSASGCACTLPVRGNVALVPVSPGLYNATPQSSLSPQLERGPAFGEEVDEDPDDGPDWPAYRHDAGRSNLTETSVDGPLRFAWKQQLAGTITAPIVAAGLVFVGTDRHAIHALDAGTGRQRWRYATGGDVRVTPAHWKGRVYAGGQDGWVYCLRAADGALIWRFRGAPLDRKALIFGKPESLWPIGGGVIVEDGVAYFYAGRSSHDRVFVYKLDAKTGEVLWLNDKAERAVDVTGPAGGISPHGVSPNGIIAASKDLLYVPHGPTFPAAFRKSDGTLMWWNRRGDSTERSNISIQPLGGSHLALGGGLLFAGGTNRLSGKNQPFIAVDAKTGRIWGQDDPRLFEKVKRDPTGKTILPQNYLWGTYAITFGRDVAPVVVDGGIFTFRGYRGDYKDLKGYLETQFAKPKATLDNWQVGVPGGTLIVAGDTAVFGNGKTLTAVRRDNGRHLWKASAPTAGSILPNSLAAARGHLFAVTDGAEVVCYSKASRP